jgi:uncharacterized membrane protein YeaQ/YmgE (transglycosylase-associated protein family)
MTLEEAAVLLIVATVCGLVAQTVVGFTRAGFVASVVLGFAGAIVMAWLAESLRLPAVLSFQVGEGQVPIFWAAVGAAGVAMIVGILTPSTRH